MADKAQTQVSEPDLTEPSDERKAELRTAYQEGADAPYRGVHIGTLGEIYWIFSERNWSGKFKVPKGMTRSNLSGADLTWAHLSGADLNGADLSAADLSAADLRGANLSAARLPNADLRTADLSTADLTRALLNSEINLDGVTFTQPPVLLGVRWNGAPLDGVDWSQVDRLGDEAAIRLAKTRKERVQAYPDAARAYHGLVVALEAQGLVEQARYFRKRERTLERQRLRTSPRTWFGYGFYSLLNLISGQGEEPGRIFIAYAIIISLFTGIYWAVSHQFHTSARPLQWYEALVLSLSSFHGRGFFPSQIGLGDPLAMIAAVEAVVGLFIELILIATFTNRFLNK
jgi:uncharacterized protein YjbI with pentapeptide repeats